MLFLKACQRCQGDLILEPLDYELICLQCSHRSPYNPSAATARRSPKPEARAGNASRAPVAEAAGRG
jgi:hypothetical protein